MYGKRVVVTGLGVISPLGLTIEEHWSSLVHGVSGIGIISLFDASGLQVQIAGEVKGFAPEDYMDKRAARRMSRFAQFAVASSGQALADARLEITDANRYDAGVFIGTGGGGIMEVGLETEVLVRRGPDRVSPMTVPAFLPNMASCQPAIMWGIKGPVTTNIGACAAGIYSFVEAMHYLRRGDISAALVGGAESAMVPLTFISLGRIGALSRRNTEPQRASRPFDRDRDGFVFAEGAGAAVLETQQHAERRGARIYCELAGGSLTSDGYHVSAPEPTGTGAAMAMQKAIADAETATDEIEYICAHGTGTPLNDTTETRAIKLALGEHAYRIPVSSPKSMFGHLLGAAGALSGLSSILTLDRRIVAPTVNLENPDPECDLDYVPLVAREQYVRTVMANGFGFGGQNSVIVFKEYRA